MNKPFAVHGTHITDSKPKLLSRHADEDAANAEAARLRRLVVNFWDGPAPVYRDVTVEGPPVAGDTLHSLYHKYAGLFTPPRPKAILPIAPGGSNPAPQPDDMPTTVGVPDSYVGVDPADPDGDTTVVTQSAYRMLDLMCHIDDLPADVREQIERRIAESFSLTSGFIF